MMDGMRVGGVAGWHRVNAGEMTRAGETGSAPRSFKEALMESMEKANRLQTDVDVSVTRLTTGAGVDNVAEVLGAVRKSETAFRMLMQIQDRILEAYREINDVR